MLHQDPADEADRPPWLPVDLFPFDSRFTSIDGARVHYVDEGQGPTLLMLHGNPTYSFLYRNVILHLRDAFRCVALDYPGFGRSTPAVDYTFTPREHARIVATFLEDQDLTGVTLVGQDWGGPIGLWAAGQHPERVDNFVLANTWAWPVEGDPHFERYSKLLGSNVGGAIVRRTNALVNLLLPLGCAHTPSQRVLDAYRGPFPTPESRKPTHRFGRELLAASDFLEEAEVYLEKFSQRPALIPWGARDLAFRKQERTRLAQAFQQPTTHVFEDASHYLPEDAPGRLANAIRDWHPGA